MVAHLEPAKLPTETDEDGRITGPKAAVAAGPRAAGRRGRLLDMHANTWRYNQVIAQQRAILVERRDKLLRTPTAPARSSRSARRSATTSWPRSSSEERLERICRLIMLYHLDRGWADHLA